MQSLYYYPKKYEIETDRSNHLKQLFNNYDLAKLQRSKLVYNWVPPNSAREVLKKFGITDKEKVQRILARADPDNRAMIKYSPFMESVRVELAEDHALVEIKVQSSELGAF